MVFQRKYVIPKCVWENLEKMKNEVLRHSIRGHSINTLPPRLFGRVVFSWKPGQSSKFRLILATQETLTDFHGDEAKKIQDGRLKKN